MLLARAISEQQWRLLSVARIEGAGKELWGAVRCLWRRGLHTLPCLRRRGLLRLWWGRLLHVRRRLEAAGLVIADPTAVPGNPERVSGSNTA